MSIRMISIGSHRYAGVWLKAGDQFTVANERDAKELIRQGFAQRGKSVTAQTYDTRVLTASTAAPAASGDAQAKRGYRHRNSTAR